MSSPWTRKQYRKSLEQASRFWRTNANSELPTTLREVMTIESLGNFVDLATLNPIIGIRVEVLIVDIQHENAFSVSQLRAALLLAPNVQDLFLFLPSPVPPALLTNIHFRDLQFFATNVAHASLVDFLPAQRTLSSLILGSCSRRSQTCPLASLAMPDLTMLQCHATCLDALPYSQVSRLTLKLPESGGCMPTLLRGMSHPASLVALSSLTVDFFPDDYDILDSVIQAAPNVQKLKLVEKKKSMRRENSARRPWNNRAEWHKALFNLPLLGELTIVTLSSLIVGEPGQADEELRFIQAWTGASGRNRTASDPHPSLYHITLRYGAQTATAGALSHWYKRAGIWVRTTSSTGPLVELGGE